MHANHNCKDKFADQLLDASLAGYSAEEPRAGLEQRILARLASEPQPADWRAWRWLPVGALAVAALLAAALLLPRRETAPVPPTTVAQRPDVKPSTPPVPAPLAPTVFVHTPRPHPSAREHRAAATVARAQQFPRPGSLNEEERHLMSYLNSTPREVLVAAVRSNRQIAELSVRDVFVREVDVPMLELKPLPEQSGEAMEN